MDKCTIKDFQTKQKILSLGLLSLPRIGDRLTLEIEEREGEEKKEGIKGRVMDIHHIYKVDYKSIFVEVIIEVQKEIDGK